MFQSDVKLAEISERQGSNMAKVEFVEAIQCKCCGAFVVKMNIFTSALCQNCGTYILDIDKATRTASKTSNSKWIVVKVTHKLFHKPTYEKVRDL